MRKFFRSPVGLLLAGLAVLAVAGCWAVRHFDVSLRFLVEQALEEAGIDSPRLAYLLQPPPRYSSGVLDGEVRSLHPRILLPELADWDGVGIAPPIVERLALYRQQGIELDDYTPCRHKQAISHVVCWLISGEVDEARSAIALMLSSELVSPTEKKTGDAGWAWALAFDLLETFPGLTQFERGTIRSKLIDSLNAHLLLLDGESVSLWHGRSSLAAQAWLLAVALHGEAGYDPDLTVRAQGHFRQTISALALTEAWPEGYNYWINNRGVELALAASAYLNGLEGSRFSPVVRQTLRRVGLWTVYATRPDNRVEGLGDEGPRVDLKDETRRVIDLTAQLTGDAVFASYSLYLERVHRRASYYSGHRWSFVLFNDPSISPLPGVAAGQLAGLDRYLPLSELFGAGAFNLFIARTGWGADDTMITFRAGHTFTHHGHYDAGHFTLFKGAPLAVDSSKYNGFFSPNRLYYSLRTIAKNSLLIVRPGDVASGHPLLEKKVNDGGQRLVIPTGSRVRDVRHWRRHLHSGNHFEGGELLHYQSIPGHMSYLRADLTGAYDSTRHDSKGAGGKVRSVEREMLYLYKEDRLLVHDKVVATDASYVKRWLLHTVNKPRVRDARVVLGNEEAGVLESSADTAVVENGRGRLDVKRILPEGAIMRLVGGAGYEHYVEADRGGSFAGGENFGEGGVDRSWFDNGAWRLELVPGAPRAPDQFLVALSPGLGRDRSGEVSALEVTGGEAVVIKTSDHVLVFSAKARLGKVSFILPEGQRTLLLVGVVAGESYQLLSDGDSLRYQAPQSGVLEMDLPLGAVTGTVVTIRPIWR